MPENLHKLFVISSPSGGGKTSLINKLFEDSRSANFKKSISDTSRQKRQGDLEGKDYYFLSEKDFKDKIKKDEYVEFATVFGNFYGTEKKSVSENLKKGVNVILEIDWQGALQIKSCMPSCVMIFLIPPSKEVLLTRLKNRGTDSDQEIAYRFNQAVLDLEQSNKFDHVLVNDQLDKVVTEIALCIEGKANKINQSKKVAESLKSFFETN